MTISYAHASRTETAALERAQSPRAPEPRAPDYAPVAELLANAGVELRGLCAAAYDLEAAVGALITARGPMGAEGLRGLQELDRLIQHIDGLADYLQALAEASEGLGEIDASAARRLIKIARLADGLAGRRRPKGAEEEDGDGVEFL